MGLFDLFKRKPVAESDASRQEAVDSAVDESAAPSRLRGALNRTRAFLTAAFATDPAGLVDEEFYDELVDAFVLADVGSKLAQTLTAAIKDGMRAQGLVRRADVPRVARQVIGALLGDAAEPAALDPAQLSVVLLVGVNGSGKTTLAAKLAHRLRSQGRHVLLVAADTFRAAAVDQLRIWAGRAGVEIVAGQEGADPASVVYDAAQAARARGVEVMLVDTAGRLQTKKNLMEELGKVSRTVVKACPGANIAHLLVLDATVGQNALSQALLFNEACRLSGLAVTKLDGTARGGALLAVVDRLHLPVLYAGIGESLEDLVDFEPSEFAAGLLPEQG